MEDVPSSSFAGLRTGTSHAFVHTDPRAEIRSDFDHTNRVTLEDAEPGRPPYAEAHAVRHKRPGSILLPIFSDPIFSDGEETYLTSVGIRPSGGQNTLPDEPLELACVQSADRKRVAVYSPELTHVYGTHHAAADPASLVGPDADSVPIRGADHPNGINLLMCATTLAGDPHRPSPVGPPPPTAVDPPTRPTSGEVWVRLGPQRDTEPSAKKRRTESPTTDDVALFQIAPLLLQSNLEPAERLYIGSSIRNHNFVYDVMEACWTAFGADGEFGRAFDDSFPTSTPETCEAAADAGNVATTDNNEEDSRPLLSPHKMYLIETEDSWIQDQMATGYCSAPGGRAINVVLHCKRERALQSFVEQEMPRTGRHLSVFNGISVRVSEPEEPGTTDHSEPEEPGTTDHSDPEEPGTTDYSEPEELGTTDYGGNLAVSPPVRQETAADSTRWAGPPVPEHPPAPHGKIILGDCHNPNRSSDGEGLIHDETSSLLQAQEMQPLVPVDTSWLAVGHVDEILTFVPGADRPKLAMAHPDVMRDLFTATAQIGVEAGRTHAHRGRHAAHSVNIGSIIAGASSGDLFAQSYDETSVEALLEEDRAINHQAYVRFLRPIERRVCHCTGLRRPDDVLPLPVYFCCFNPMMAGGPWGRKKAIARMPDVVNMQVLKTEQNGTHLLVPRPCGPRLPPGQAREVVRSVLDTHGQPDTPVQVPRDEGGTGFPFWVWKNLKARTLALFFTHKKRDEQGNLVFVTAEDRAQMISVIKREWDFNTLPATLQEAVRTTKDTILNVNGGKEALLESGKFTGWHRLFIPENTVDVVAAYTQSVLGRAGRTVHFVDDWFCHTDHGEVHCATNVLRKAPATDSPQHPERPPWWQAYPDLAAADTDYDPNNTVHPDPS